MTPQEWLDEQTEKFNRHWSQKRIRENVERIQEQQARKIDRLLEWARKRLG